MEQDNKIKRVLFNEVSLVVGAIGLISSIIFWVQNPQQKLKEDVIRLQSQVESSETVTAALERIKNNDLHEIQLRMDRLEARQINLLESNARIEALLKPLTRQ